MNIGIDIGGMTVKAGLVDEDGHIVKALTCPTKKTYPEVLEDLKKLCQNIIDSSKKNGREVQAIGVGVPGIVKKGEVLNAPNIFWKNEPLAKDLSEATGLPVSLINDATAVAVAENRIGAAVDKDSVVIYTLGTGVGGGIILDGKVVEGAHGIASEFGHTLHGPNFYTCNCGKNGCLETYASATGLIKRYQKETGKELTAREIFERAGAGDKVAQESVSVVIDKLSDSISNLIDILDPEVFVVGGGLSKAGDALFVPLRKAVRKKVTFPELADTPILPAALENEAGIVGAAFSGEYL